MASSSESPRSLKKTWSGVAPGPRNKDKPWYDPEYPTKALHDDLEKGRFFGFYGGCNQPWHALAEAQAGRDLHSVQMVRSPDEFYIPMVEEHLKSSFAQTRWQEIVSIDPYGMWAKRPTMAATYAKMYLPELLNEAERDGVVVAPDGGINVVKWAVDYVWNIPGISKRLGLGDSDIRAALKKYTSDARASDSSLKTYLPPIGGVTIYVFGDIRKLADPNTEVALRPHDECNGSDVFGTDICTCRPYLIYGIQAAVECAQRGGVGLIIYYRKEGRGLGEVTKFRVYNARKAQAGGDRPEKYFFQTESIAGVRDARFQPLMADILLMLGIRRIDWLVSMSSDKFEAIDSAGIDVMQRISIPDEMVPAGATVEITAKISAGYHTDNVSSADVRAHLRKLTTIRERCGLIFERGREGKLKHFSLDLSKMPNAVKRVVDCIKTHYPALKIPYHGRMRHFEAVAGNKVSELMAAWPCDKLEKTRRLIDLVTVAVLLDAGAGKEWKYTNADRKVFSRSEGLAAAALDMFLSGAFSSDDAQPHRVNSLGLKRLKVTTFESAFQVSATNRLLGVEGRLSLLLNLGEALDSNPEFFGKEICRPGNIIDYVAANAKDGEISIHVIWRAIVEGLEQVWPASLSGVRRGDVWTYSPLKRPGHVGSDFVPFHKLSQWLIMSLLEPIESMGFIVTDREDLTALAEYRNGGLFVDTGVLSLLDPLAYGVEHPVGSELVVEWRALTVMLIDICAAEVRKTLGLSVAQLPLPSILEGGTWRAGRIIASEKREDGSPPIRIRSEGTVF
jgi:GTP cyclohydrolase II